ncbi:GTP cyclohydrolase I FolE [Candidatus Bipolaricaulota bacterium]|nr:GTP cyclohydrolase I FolE [Candidatus Bipolaricaulota bacterium]
MDLGKIEAGVRLILEGLGQGKLSQEMWANTPRRVAEALAELCFGLEKNPEDELEVTFLEPYDEMVVLRDVPFHSLCEHHLLPFIGRASLVYLPKGGRVVGVSKLARVLEVAAARPQLQERLTSQVADALMEKLRPHGVLVQVQAEHLCMTIRGVKKPGSTLVTSAIRGLFRTDPAARAEALALISRPAAP